MEAISHGKGVLACERYEKMDAQFFTSFIDQHFDTMFERSGKGLNRLWLQDGDPSQNSKSAKKDAIDQSITRESYQEFCDRVRRAIYDISRQLIDKTIESMNTRIADIIRNNGERLEY